MATDTLSIGSVGSRVGAALETAGHYVQSGLLDYMNGQLGSNIAFFLFVLCGFAAVFSFAVMGQYRMGKMLLIGPALFYLMIAARVESTGADWTFGERVYPKDEVLAAAANTSPNLPSGITVAQTKIHPVHVSWFFALWNRLSSGMVNTAVSGLYLAGKNSDYSAFKKIDRFAQLMEVTPQDPTLKAFVQMTALSKCANFYMIQRELVAPTLNPLRKQQLMKELDDITRFPVLGKEDKPMVTQWIVTLGLRQYFEDTFQKKFDEPWTLTCNDLWKLSTRAFAIHSTALMATIADYGREPWETREEVLESFREKYAAIPTANDNQLKSYPNESIILLVNEMAGRMLLREMSHLSPELISMDFSGQMHSPDGGTVYYGADTASKLRILQKTDEYEEKGDFFMAMMALPYLQGMILYFLSAAFPFAAFLLIVPTRQKMFLNWMALWVWAKSWDFGFAVVMIIENMLYAFMPHSEPISSQALGDTGTALKMLLEVDPTYSVHTYFNLLATCMAAIPALTGLLVKKGGGHMLSFVGTNLTEFSGRIGGAMASYARNMHAEGALTRFNQGLQSHANQMISDAIRDPAVKNSLTQSINTGIQAAIAGKAAGGVASPMLLARSGQHRAVAGAGFSANVNTGMHNYAARPEMRELAHEANLVKYYNHGFFVSSFPAGEYMTHKLSMYSRPYGKSIGEAADKALGLAQGGVMSASKVIPQYGPTLAKLGIATTVDSRLKSAQVQPSPGAVRPTEGQLNNAEILKQFRDQIGANRPK